MFAINKIKNERLSRVVFKMWDFVNSWCVWKI